MIGMLMPELVLLNTLQAMIKLLRDDLTTHENNNEQTILYKLFGLDENQNPLQSNLYNVFDQAKKMILTKGNLMVNYGYNQKVAQNLSLHILLPSESATMAIGADEGYLEEDDIDPETLKSTFAQNYFTQTYKSTYQIMITSTNSAEVMVIYNLLKCMMLMFVEHLELMGLRNPEFSGNDIVMQDDLTPVPIFHKVFNISFMYENNVPQLLKAEFAKNLYFQMRAVVEEQSTKQL